MHHSPAAFGCCVLLSGLLLSAACARADEGIFSEVRLGAFWHDAQTGSGFREHGADINGELLFTTPVPDGAVVFAPQYLRWLLEPRPMIGFQANTSGYTSQGYLGLTWTVTLFENLFRPTDALLFDVGFGPSLNDGSTGFRPGYKRLGSNVLFRTNADIGYRVTPHIAAYIEFDHESNAGLARNNQGLSQVGLRIGYIF